MAASLLFLSGCGREEQTGDGLFKIVLQTDWYAQPEHGGFYQAVAQGYYAEEGLSVEILPGGPNALGTEKVAQGRVQFAIGRSDDVIIHTSRGVPLLIAGALMQKDPQAIMFHRESGIERFEDLDGKVVMAGPGSPFIEIIQRKYNISMRITPLDYGMARFIADKTFIQQCFITNEPYYVRRQGADPGMLLIADSGFSPYRVWYTSREFADRNPQIVEAFTRATIRGWHSYLYGDPTDANAVIASRNPQMDADFMAYSRQAMIRYQLVDGSAEAGEGIGKINPARLAEQIQQLLDIGMIREAVTVEQLFKPELMPDAFPRGPFTAKRLPFTTERQNDTDLEIMAAWPGSSEFTSRFISAATLASLPHQDFDKALDVGGLHNASGILLADLIAHIGPPADEYTVLANCSDFYQSNFSPAEINAHQPVLITQVAGKSTAEWAAHEGNPGWGPYLIDILVEDGLVVPSHKKPWGVTQLVLADRNSLLAGLQSPESAPQGMETVFHAGREIFMQSCASCHQVNNQSLLGGKLSNFNLPHLAIHAAYNADYFRNILQDPVGTNPAAALMPDATAWTEAQREQLRLWIAAHTPATD